MNKQLIVIAEHKVIQFGLKAFIESASAWRVVFAATGKEELLAKMQEDESVLSVPVVLVNNNCADGNIYSVINLLKEKNPAVKCIIYSNNSSYGDIIYAFEKGVEGFLSTDSDDNELLLAIDAVSKGKTYIQQDLMREILLISNKLSLLTPREKQIYDMICNGLDKQEICIKFKISVRTCENYFSQLYSKLGVANIAELQEAYGITKNRLRRILIAENSQPAQNISSNKLTLIQDDSYDGMGVKILYKNVPSNASVLEITLHNGEKREQVTFMENTALGKNHEYFNLGYYVYPFLAAGKEYTFDFVFKTSTRKIVERACITVVPLKGEEISIQQTNTNVIINPHSFECFIPELPKINLPQETRFCINAWDSNWSYLGEVQKNLSDSDCFGPYYLYNDITYRIPKKDLESVKTVLFQFYFAYECYEWNYYISGIMPFSAEKLP